MGYVSTGTGLFVESLVCVICGPSIVASASCAAGDVIANPNFACTFVFFLFGAELMYSETFDSSDLIFFHNSLVLSTICRLIPCGIYGTL